MDLTASQKKAILREFGRKAEAAVREKFGTKEEFLRQTGIYRKTLHDILTGAKDPHLTTVYRIARALQISPKDLFP